VPVKVQVVIQAADGTERTEVCPAEGPISVGRHPQSVLCIDSDAVSRQHVVVQAGPSTIRIEDFSTNGTLAGDRLLRRQAIEVLYGTPIVVGDYTIYFFPFGALPGKPAVPPPVPKPGDVPASENGVPVARVREPAPTRETAVVKQRNRPPAGYPAAVIVDAVHPPPAAAPYVPAARLPNRYQVGNELGRGGVSVVYEATELGTGASFAIKVLNRAPIGEAGANQAMLIEAQLATRLTSPHAVRLLEVGVAEDGRPFFVMERLAGNDLARQVREHGPMSVPAASEVVLQACHALAEAHRMGVVHRDIKPANLFLSTRPDGSPHVKVLDFGLATMVAPALDDPDGAPVSQTMHASGSAGYAAPEQIGSQKRIDERADVWALGVVLYELVTGHRPFEGESLIESLIAAGSEPLPPMGSVPPAFESIVRRCLQREAELRFPDVVALAEALGAFAPVRIAGLVEHIRRARAKGTELSGSPHTFHEGQGPLSSDSLRSPDSTSRNPASVAEPSSTGGAPPSIPGRAPPPAGSKIVSARAVPWLPILAVLAVSAVAASFVISRPRGTTSVVPQPPAVSATSRTPSMRLPPLPRPSASAAKAPRANGSSAAGGDTPGDWQEAP
jgi:eukaryotic-like serine/threonine-protein kinase